MAKVKLDLLYDAYLEALASGAGTSDVEERLYNSLKTLTTSLSYKVLHQNDEDFAHDSAVNILLALPGFRGDSLFSTWAYRLALNAAISARRKSKKTVDLEVADELESGTDVHQEVFVKMLRDELDEESLALLDKMLEPGFTVRQYADDSGTPRETARRRVNELKKRLEALCYGAVGKQI